MLKHYQLLFVILSVCFYNVSSDLIEQQQKDHRKYLAYKNAYTIQQKEQLVHDQEQKYFDSLLPQLKTASLLKQSSILYAKSIKNKKVQRSQKSENPYLIVQLIDQTQPISLRRRDFQRQFRYLKQFSDTLNPIKKIQQFNKLGIQLTAVQINQIKMNALLNAEKFNSAIYPNCTKKHKVAYVWIGQKEIPQAYQKILIQCQNTAILLGNEHLIQYANLWNSQQQQQELKIDLNEYDHVQQIDMLKVLYLYFQGGVYSDFDTQMNQDCFDNIITDRIVFGNINYLNGKMLLPEENFMFVRQKRNKQVYELLIRQIKDLDRWLNYQVTQGVIVNCFMHFRENTYNVEEFD